MKLTDKLLDALEVHVEPFAICDVRCGSSLNIEPDEFNTIHYTLAGRGRLVTDTGESIPLEPDQMILIPAGMSQNIVSLTDDDGSTLASAACLQPADGIHWLQAGAGDMDIVLACGRIRVTYGQEVNIFGLLKDPVVEPFVNSAFIRGAFETMLQEFSDPKMGTLTMTSILMKQCLILLLRRLHEQQDWRIPWLAVLDNPRMANALNAMLEQPEKSHRVEELADLAFMSRSAFTDHFTRLFGQPPHEFLTNYRLRRAAHLLTTGNLPVQAVAGHIGYQSRSSFSRAFKSLYGLDPASYRKQHS